MDYVKRSLEKARQQRIEEKIEEAMNQHKRAQQSIQGVSDTGSSAESFFSTGRKLTLVLLGVAAGVAIIAMTLWMKPDESGIKSLRQNIDLLNRRVELQGNSIASLEEKLARLLVLAESSREIESADAAGARQEISKLSDEMLVIDSNWAASVTQSPVTATREERLAPTHSVAVKLNLRPSASLDTVPLRVLPAGTRVEKISENGDWYYVNTEAHGKGWCYSGYLSPLL